MKNIGFLSRWGVGGGLAYVTLGFIKSIKDDYNCFVLKQGENPIDGEFIIFDDKKYVTETPDYNVPGLEFAEWVAKNELDVIIFNEYNQWNNNEADLINIAKTAGCKVYGYLVMERFKDHQAAQYDRLLVPTVSFMKFLRRKKIRNFTYIPYSIDLKEFKKPKDDSCRRPFTFFHPGGRGGVLERKNTRAVIEAFERLDNKDSRLVITSQIPLQFNKELHPNIKIINEDLSRKDLIKHYYEADAVVLPSKWETIGIPILEALAAGKPVITTNIPPMNEFIREGLNGYLCKYQAERYEGIEVVAAEVEIRSLKINMENIMNEGIYPMLSRNSRFVIEELYNLEKNNKYFLGFLQNDLR